MTSWENQHAADEGSLCIQMGQTIEQNFMLEYLHRTHLSSHRIKSDFIPNSASNKVNYSLSCHSSEDNEKAKNTLWLFESHFIVLLIFFPSLIGTKIGIFYGYQFEIYFKINCAWRFDAQIWHIA